MKKNIVIVLLLITIAAFIDSHYILSKRCDLWHEAYQDERIRCERGYDLLEECRKIPKEVTQSTIENNSPAIYTKEEELIIYFGNKKEN